MPSRGRLGLYRTDWLTFSFEPLGELTVSFEAYGLASPKVILRFVPFVFLCYVSFCFFVLHQPMFFAQGFFATTWVLHPLQNKFVSGFRNSRFD